MITLEKFLKGLDDELDIAPQRSSYKPEQWEMRDLLNAMYRIGRTMTPDFVFDEQNMDTYRQLGFWFMNDSRMTAFNPNGKGRTAGRLGKGIYLAGNTGTGKTTAFNILRFLYRKNPFKCLNNEMKWREMRADDIAAIYAKMGDIIEIKKEPFLCIQDLGCEPLESIYMGNRMNVMQDLLCYRGDRRDFVTMITSNIPLEHEDIRKRYGDRVQSRMIEMMNYLTLTGKDRRKNNGNTEVHSNQL